MTHHHNDDGPARPRYGALNHTDGTTTPLVFHQDRDDPSLFIGADAATGDAVRVRPGDRLTVDVIGAGQGVQLHIEPAAGPPRGIVPDGPPDDPDGYWADFREDQERTAIDNFEHDAGMP